MPDLGIGELLSIIIPAATTGTSIGLQASGALSPSGPSLSQSEQLAKQQEVAANKQAQLQSQEAFKAFAPDAQAQTGGALSDASFANLVAELSGQPGNMELAQQTIFGNAGTQGSGTGLAA
jgi:hypothetical protein